MLVGVIADLVTPRGDLANQRRVSADKAVEGNAIFPLCRMTEK